MEKDEDGCPTYKAEIVIYAIGDQEEFTWTVEVEYCCTDRLCRVEHIMSHGYCNMEVGVAFPSHRIRRITWDPVEVARLAEGPYRCGLH